MPHFLHLPSNEESQFLSFRVVFSVGRLSDMLHYVDVNAADESYTHLCRTPCTLTETSVVFSDQCKAAVVRTKDLKDV